MCNSCVKYFAFLGLAIVGLASRSEAGPIVTVPPGLVPGDTYRLVFTTSTTMDAVSTNIGVYNSFVTTAADSVAALMKLDATWTVIGSTATVSAIQNIGASGATTGIYDLAGTEVADNTSGLFSGGNLLAPISITQTGGSATDFLVSTGTTAYGLSDTHLGPLGNTTIRNCYALACVQTGYVDSNQHSLPTGWWIASNNANVPSNKNHFYAISSVLTVADAPEPGSMVPAGLGAAILLAAARRKRRPAA